MTGGLTASTLGLGLAAGLGVAVPIGAIGVLLLGEGMAVGARRGIVAASAVALVDTLYAAAAITLGTVAAPAVDRFGTVPQVVGGFVLLAVAAAGARRGSPGDPPHPPRRVAAAHRFALFVGLTALNPATLLYFVAIAVPTGRLSLAESGLFVVGVALASFTWQVLLVVAGAVFGSRLPDRARRRITAAGSAVIAVLAATLIIAGIWG